MIFRPQPLDLDEWRDADGRVQWPAWYLESLGEWLDDGAHRVEDLWKKPKPVLNRLHVFIRPPLAPRVVEYKQRRRNGLLSARDWSPVEIGCSLAGGELAPGMNVSWKTFSEMTTVPEACFTLKFGRRYGEFTGDLP